MLFLNGQMVNILGPVSHTHMVPYSWLDFLQYFKNGKTMRPLKTVLGP